MEIQIIDQQVIRNSDKCRYYLELTLSEYVDSMWQESYNEALKREAFTSLYGSGAPVVNKIYFNGNKIITREFPEFAIEDAKTFITELKKFITIANSIYNTKLTLIQQEQELKVKEQEDRKKKIEELNKKLNS